MKYYTAREVSEIRQLHIKFVQRKAKELLNGKEVIKTKRQTYLIAETVLHKFSKVYFTKTINPTKENINIDEWNLFCDFLPKERLAKDEPNEAKSYLIGIMESLFNIVKAKTKKALKIWYIIEYQPKASFHVHYYVKSDEDIKPLIKLIYNTIKKQIESNQDIQIFNNSMKELATEYLQKGLASNWKNADYIFGGLLTKGMRKK